jgi:hypothetical protein
MAVPNTFSNGTVADADEVNENFAYVGVVPVGAVISWLKTLTNCPALDDRFVECNGQVLSDADSVFNGVTLPNLNGNLNVLYGKSTSGTTRTEDFLPVHNHNLAVGSADASDPRIDATTGATALNGIVIQNSSAAGTAWLGYSVVYIIRVK